MRFYPFDVVHIAAHNAKPGEGLSYPACRVVVLDEGFSGGWDIYDGYRSTDSEPVSFYGFSVTRVISAGE